VRCPVEYLVLAQGARQGARRSQHRDSWRRSRHERAVQQLGLLKLLVGEKFQTENIMDIYRMQIDSGIVEDPGPCEHGAPFDGDGCSECMVQRL